MMNTSRSTPVSAPRRLAVLAAFLALLLLAADEAVAHTNVRGRMTSSGGSKGKGDGGTSNYRKTNSSRKSSGGKTNSSPGGKSRSHTSSGGKGSRPYLPPAAHYPNPTTTTRPPPLRPPTQTTVAAAPIVLCPDGREPVHDTPFCGRGPYRADCGEGEFCHIHPADRFAVCCNDPPPTTTTPVAPKTTTPAAPTASSAAGGSCQFCGGIGGLRCGAGLTCVDDASDWCDPKTGGADCGGCCVLATTTTIVPTTTVALTTMTVPKTVAPTTRIVPTTVAPTTTTVTLETASFPDLIYPENAVFTCDADAGDSISADHINPCVEYGEGTYPHDAWWTTVQYDNDARRYIQCGEGGPDDCTVVETPPGQVWNPYMGGYIGGDLVDPNEIGGNPVPVGAPPGGLSPECDALNYCDNLRESSRYNTCLLAANGIYGEEVRSLPWDLEGFCNGAPYWLFGTPPTAPGQSPEDIIEIPAAILDDAKYIECDDLGGCSVRECTDGTTWNQEAQMCV